MNIKKLCPISEYKGPVLKLTKQDKDKIAKLESSIAELECDIYNINKQMGASRLTVQKESFFLDRLFRLEAYIDTFKDQIREIKLNRLNKQKAKKREF